jgi:SAM-dependent methyltransferase
MTILNLGCGNAPLTGNDVVNHDRTHFAPHVDVAHDLNSLPWPWPDATFEAILAHSVLEHLDSFYAFFNEAWRILAPGGTIEVVVPRWDHVNVAIDPTHKRGYHIESFDFLDPDTKWGAKASMYSPYRWKLLESRELITGGVKSDIWALLEVRK